MKKIIILGGGAAGWLTALFAKKVFPQNSIHLIESTKIGILGAGEGSTPHLINFFQYLDINVWDLISKTKGTIKFGINFENWNGDGKKYFHNFASHNRLDSFKIKNTFDEGCYQKYLINCCSKNLNLNESPVLSWKWRIWDIPAGADERNDKVNDTAASVYVVFKVKRMALVKEVPQSIRYTWSSSLPVGTEISTFFGHQKIAVVGLFVRKAVGEFIVNLR